MPRIDPRFLTNLVGICDKAPNRSLYLCQKTIYCVFDGDPTWSDRDVAAHQ